MGERMNLSFFPKGLVFGAKRYMVPRGRAAAQNQPMDVPQVNVGFAVARDGLAVCHLVFPATARRFDPVAVAVEARLSPPGLSGKQGGGHPGRAGEGGSSPGPLNQRQADHVSLPGLLDTVSHARRLFVHGLALSLHELATFLLELPSLVLGLLHRLPQVVALRAVPQAGERVAPVPRLVVVAHDRLVSRGCPGKSDVVGHPPKPVSEGEATAPGQA